MKRKGVTLDLYLDDSDRPRTVTVKRKGRVRFEFEGEVDSVEIRKTHIRITAHDGSIKPIPDADGIPWEVK